MAEFLILFTAYWGSSWYDWGKCCKNHRDSNKRYCGCIVKYGSDNELALCHLSPFFLPWVAVHEAISLPQSHVACPNLTLTGPYLNEMWFRRTDEWYEKLFFSFKKRRSLKNCILFTCNTVKPLLSGLSVKRTPSTKPGPAINVIFHFTSLHLLSGPAEG